MDERLEKALEFANYRQTLANQRKNVKERMKILQTVHYNSGSFMADKETISFVSTLKNLKKDNIVILDMKEKPVDIEDIDDFLEVLVSAYISATQEYKIQIDKLNKMRSIKKLMDW